MSVRWFDGFNNITTPQLANDYRDVSGGITVSTGRDSTTGLVGAASTDFLIRDCTPTNAIRGAVGMAIYVSTLPALDRMIFSLLDSADQAVFTLVLRTDGTLDLVSGGTPSNPSYLAGSIALPTTSWSYIEVGFELSSTDGTLVLRVDGELHVQSGIVAFVPPLTWFSVMLFPNAGLDDLYIVDGAGSPNWLLTPQRVWTVVPGSVGDNADWTSSTGMGTVDDVDETTPDNDSSYIWAEDDLAITTFIMSITPEIAPSQIHAVSLNFVARDDSLNPTELGPVGIRPVARSAGVTHPIPTASEGMLLTDTYALGRYTWTLNPATASPWTQATLGAMQFGVERHDEL